MRIIDDVFRGLGRAVAHEPGDDQFRFRVDGLRHYRLARLFGGGRELMVKLPPCKHFLSALKQGRRIMFEPGLQHVDGTGGLLPQPFGELLVLKLFREA
ncbi:MAG: hypothetical protein P4M05_24060 [Bradyrhizobium sp.]|nr:hypothetical protein [Bradyrhizobium sp.]